MSGPGYDEPTAVEMALWDRYNTIGWHGIGPLTRDQADAEAKYEAYMEEAWAEEQARVAAGGRTICPKCGERSVTDSTVCTLGYPGHPGADYSALYECENCDYRSLAG